MNGPGAPGVRDYMLSYMANVFVGGAAHSQLVGHHRRRRWSRIVFGFLLLSAVNTAIVDLVAISFLMARDGELPDVFQKLNRFGVPNAGIIVATVVPAVLVVAVQ